MAKKWLESLKEYRFFFGSLTGSTIFFQGGLAAMTAGGGVTLVTVLALLRN